MSDFIHFIGENSVVYALTVTTSRHVCRCRFQEANKKKKDTEAEEERLK